MKPIFRKLGNKALWVYIALAAVLLGPLLKPGYILTLDMVFTPHMSLPSTVTSSYLLNGFFHVLNQAIPVMYIQKILLIVTLIVAGLGMHLLIKTITLPHKLPTMAYYFGGIMYVLNPFSYGRFMAGQYSVLLGYALLPWSVRLLLAYFANPTWKTALSLTGVVTLISIVSIHSVGLVAVVAGLVVAGHVWRARRDRSRLWAILRSAGLVAGLWVVASSYWLVPMVLGTGSQAQQVSNFTDGDRQAFATVGDNALEKIGNVLRLQGFWAEGHGLFVLPQYGLPVGLRWLWWPTLAAVLVLVCLGAVSWWQQGRRNYVLLFGSCIAIGAVLAAGIGGDWLAVHVPFFAGYREPQKFAALIALGYAVLAAGGLAAVVGWFDKRPRLEVLSGIVVPVALAVPFIWTSSFVWGARGQLHATDYPAGWYAVNQQLNADKDDFQVLSLPWHLYLYSNFAGRVVANPTQKFFDKPLIISDNPEFAGAARDRPSVTKRQIDAALQAAKATGKPLWPTLQSIHIKYVILTKDSDYQQYDWLSKQAQLKPIFQDSQIILYHNQAYRR